MSITLRRRATTRRRTVADTDPLPYVGPTDGFSGTLAAWDDAYGGPTIVAGRGRVPCHAISPGVPDYAGLETLGANSRRFVNRHFLVEVPVVPSAGGATAFAVAQVWIGSVAAGFKSGTRAGFTYNAVTGLLSFDDQIDYSEGGRVSVTYSSAAHRWWKIAHTGTAVTWSTSPTGYDGSWTVQRTLNTPPAWSGAADIGGALESWRDGGTEDYAEFDNVNIVPVAPPSGVSETWTGTTGAGWPAAWTTYGTATIQANRGRLANNSGGYSYASAWHSGATAVTDFDLTVTVYVSANGDVRFGTANVGVDWVRPDTGYTCRIEVANGTAGYASLLRHTSGNHTELGFEYSGVANSSSGWSLRMLRSGSSVKAKLWTLGSAEPGTWLIDATDSAPLSSAQRAWLSYESGGTGYAEFDNLAVT